MPLPLSVESTIITRPPNVPTAIDGQPVNCSAGHPSNCSRTVRPGCIIGMSLPSTQSSTTFLCDVGHEHRERRAGLQLLAALARDDAEHRAVDRREHPLRLLPGDADLDLRQLGPRLGDVAHGRGERGARLVDARPRVGVGALQFGVERALLAARGVQRGDRAVDVGVALCRFEHGQFDVARRGQPLGRRAPAVARGSAAP